MCGEEVNLIYSQKINGTVYEIYRWEPIYNDPVPFQVYAGDKLILITADGARLAPFILAHSDRRSSTRVLKYSYGTINVIYVKGKHILEYIVENNNNATLIVNGLDKHKNLI